jgi:hypothetical protein
LALAPLPVCLRLFVTVIIGSAPDVHFIVADFFGAGMCLEATRIGSERSTFLAAMIISKELVVDGMYRSGVKI